MDYKIMSLGNLGWNDLQIGIRGGVNNPTLFRSGEVSEPMQALPTGKRLTEDGYFTNAPLELGDDDFVHGIVYSNNAKNALTTEFDDRWKEKCPQARPTIGSISFTTIESVADDITNGRAVDGYGDNICDEEGNHYWIDKTQNYSVGCGLDEASNYTTSADYVDNSLCMYECLDVNRIPNDDGSCSDSCSEDYEIRDGICQLSSGEQLKNTITENVGMASLIIASGIALKIFLSR